MAISVPSTQFGDAARPSIGIILLLMAITLASSMVFVMLMRRWTSRRESVSLAEWARSRRMKLIKTGALPAPLMVIAQHHPRVLVQLVNRSKTNAAASIVQFETRTQSNTEDAALHERSPHPRWNLLIQRLSRERFPAAAGLRPANLEAAASVIDLFRLTPFHRLSNDRFAIFAADGKTANRLARSSARALLPPDVGLLMLGEFLLLDFSARPFDPVELDRMLSVAEQICALC